MEKKEKIIGVRRVKVIVGINLAEIGVFELSMVLCRELELELVEEFQ